MKNNYMLTHEEVQWAEARADAEADSVPVVVLEDNEQVICCGSHDNGTEWCVRVSRAFGGVPNVTIGQAQALSNSVAA